MPTNASDRDCLRAFARRPGAETLQPILDRYLPLVYASAFRRTGDGNVAVEVTRAVFAVFHRRAKKLRRRTVLAGWLHNVTRIACRKLPKSGPRRWFGLRRRVPLLPADAAMEQRVAAGIDGALDRLPARHRNAVLLTMAGWEISRIAATLRTSERRVARRVSRGRRKLARRLRRDRVRVTPDELARACATEFCSPPVPESLAPAILSATEQGNPRREKLARRTLASLAFTRWRRRILFGVPSFALLLAGCIAALVYIDYRTTGASNVLAWYIVWSVGQEAKRTPGFIQDAKPWPAAAAAPTTPVTTIRRPADLFRTTNIWQAHLKFSPEEWKRIQPRKVNVLPHFLRSDGTILLRNPNAQRSGLAGVLGFDFDFVHGDIEFGGAAFTNVAVRFKGNGTYLASLWGDKRSFKVDFNKHVKGQKLADIEEVNFTNLIEDRSYMSEALGYELFRDAGVPAPRTAYAWLTISVPGKWDRKPLGLYLLVETVEGAFAAERFGSKKAPIFKPVTYQLLEDMGDDWAAYEATYDLKTKATPGQLQRLIDLAKLVSHASDPEFRERIPTLLDLDEVARFLAVEVLLSHYDSIFSNGQNFYMYLDPSSNRFGFIPWDLDHAWGTFPFTGSVGERERASIAHPWIGTNRFLERVMAVDEFQKLYRGHLDTFVNTLFVPGRLAARIDEVARVIRSPVGAESSFRAERFEQAVGQQRLATAVFGDGIHPGRPVFPLKHFIESRAKSVRAQLDGRSKGMVLKRNSEH